MKQIDLQNKTKEELTQRMNESRARLLKLKFDLNEKRLKDVSQVGKTKKEIARILTALRQLKS